MFRARFDVAEDPEAEVAMSDQKASLVCFQQCDAARANCSEPPKRPSCTALEDLKQFVREAGHP